MRTPVILVAGQKDTDPVVGALLRTPGTLVLEHRFDGHVVRRTMVTLQHGVLTTAETGPELAHGACRAPSATTWWCCSVSCTAATTLTWRCCAGPVAPTTPHRLSRSWPTSSPCPALPMRTAGMAARF